MCNSLGSISIYRLIEQLEKWTNKTYEGKHVSFGFVIDDSGGLCGSEDFIDFLDNNHSAVFTDGSSSGILLDFNGRVVQYFTTAGDNESSDEIVFSPLETLHFALKCGKGVGVICQSSGDILVFQKKSLVFAKRNGRWVHFESNSMWSHIQKALSPSENLNDYDNKKLMELRAKEIYLTVLDAAFGHKGGCLAIIKSDSIQKVIEECVPNDNLYDMSSKTGDGLKKKIVRQLLRQAQAGEDIIFYSINRNLRLDILSLDGATIIDDKGKLYATGAIVKIGPEGSEGGGRTAAAKALSMYGMGIKISEDGHVLAYRGVKKQKKKVESIVSELVFSIK